MRPLSIALSYNWRYHLSLIRDEENTPHKTQQAHFVVRKIAVSIKYNFTQQLLISASCRLPLVQRKSWYQLQAISIGNHTVLVQFGINLYE